MPDLRKCVRKGGPPEVPDGSVVDRRVILVELMIFLDSSINIQKILFCKG